MASTVMRVANTNSDLPALVDEFAAGLFAELDYRLEAQNGERFRAQLMSTPEVKIPKTYIELSTERVLITGKRPLSDLFLRIGRLGLARGAVDGP